MVDVVVARILHLVFAAIWAGSVVYVSLAILPLARDGEFGSTAPLSVLSRHLKRISRFSAVVLLLTGGHLAGTGYTAEGLVETTNGRLVLLMVVLWLALATLVEVGAARFETGLEAKKLRQPARTALPIFRVATVVAVALLVVAGTITSGASTLI